MKANERLRWAIENHGPGDRTPRAFQRAIRGLVGKTPSSYHAVTRYLEGGRLIPEALCVAASKVTGVSVEWLAHGTGPQMAEDAPAPLPDLSRQTIHGTLEIVEEYDFDEAVDEILAAAEPEQEAPAESPYADIYAVVMAAGEQPSSDHLEILDPKYPRNGLTVRDWSILYGIVSGAESVEQAAERVELSEARVRAICDEQAEAVRNVAGINA